ncbi:MAG: hypothetical protein ACLP1X_27545 [Polyangiaceae bacterium]
MFCRNAFPVLVALAAVQTTGCGANAGAKLDGQCSATGTGWSCSTSLADASRTLPECPTNAESGGSCVVASTVDTTNPTMPARVTVPAPECFACTNSGSGTDWTCGAAGWEAIGTFACSP